MERRYSCCSLLNFKIHSYRWKAQEKKWIWIFPSNFWGWFFQLFVNKKTFKKTIVVSALKSCIKNFFNLFKNLFWIFEGVKVCHSRFNFDCNTERGFRDSLYIALGLRLYLGFLHTLLWECKRWNLENEQPAMKIILSFCSKLLIKSPLKIWISSWPSKLKYYKSFSYLFT